MLLHFFKYQGTGNDFVMLDNTNGNYDALTIAEIQHICSRKFGIGADGLIKINKHTLADFEVDYYNADGTKSFCGNGARCSVMFANKLGLIKENKTSFLAIDGMHEAIITATAVELKMGNVSEVKTLDTSIFEIHTGSPHFLSYFDSVDGINVVEYGKSIRYSSVYQAEGINVNLIQELAPNSLRVYTYERGVEDETLSCGTGVTAAALSYIYKHQLKGQHTIAIQTKGGNLSVKANYTTDFLDIWLVGPAQMVFEGQINTQ